MKKNNYTKTTDLLKIIFLLIVFLGIGYAFLEANLKVEGDTTVEAPELNVYIQSFDVVPSSVPGTAEIVGNDKNEINFTTALVNESSNIFYSIGLNFINKGSKDAYLENLDIKVYDSNNNEVSLPDIYQLYLTNNDAYNTGPGREIKVGDTQVYRIVFRYKNGIDMSTITDYPTYTFKIKYSFTTESFSNDDWQTIKTKLTSNPNNYPVGSTKTIEMDLNNDGTNENYTLRIANTSTPSECSTTGYSQTACGVVLEFTDIIAGHRMNPVDTSRSDNGYNSYGGWQYSEMRNYINTTIYNALPTDLKNMVINTNVVSGHNFRDASNFTTTDKMYLLSPIEVWGKGSEQGQIKYDTADTLTRQLDYYKNKKLDPANNLTEASKKNSDNSINKWWLRTAFSNDVKQFYLSQSGWVLDDADGVLGVSPAFRIG